MDNAISPPSESPIEGSTIDASGQQLRPSEQQPSTARLFEALRAYPFSTDREFAQGLAIILRHPDVPASEEEINRTDDLVLQAKCFYFSRCDLCSLLLARGIDCLVHGIKWFYCDV